MSSREPHPSIPIFTQTAFPEQPELDRWHQVTEEEAKLAYEMTLRNELSGGTPTVRAFEQDWREWTQSRYALTTCNGSAALYCAHFGLGVGPSDEVICPTYTWICTIAPALFLGARPVFVESDPETLQIDPDEVRRSARFGSAKLFSRWYTDVKRGKHVVVVVLSGLKPTLRHWVITAYLTRKLAEGDVEWRRD